MKTTAILLILASMIYFAEASADMGDVCTKWFDFQGQSGPYEAMQQQMSEEQIAEGFPDMAKDYKRAKTKFNLAKSKYEKTSKKKFNPDSCK